MSGENCQTGYNQYSGLLGMSKEVAFKSYKDRKYFSHPRSEMLCFIPSNAKRILDVGCGIGKFGEFLKNELRLYVDGVEEIPSIAEEAAKRLDKVFVGAFGESLGLPMSYYDCVVFNDVLEHMVDPSYALLYTKSLLTCKGCVVASIPNIRHFPTVWKLVVQGRWDYTEAGTLDRTHLRFFTRASIISMFQESGYKIEVIRGINRYLVNSHDEHRLWRYYKVLQKLAPRRFADMRYLQFAVVASPKEKG